MKSDEVRNFLKHTGTISGNVKNLSKRIEKERQRKCQLLPAFLVKSSKKLSQTKSKQVDVEKKTCCMDISMAWKFFFSCRNMFPLDLSLWLVVVTGNTFLISTTHLCTKILMARHLFWSFRQLSHGLQCHGKCIWLQGTFFLFNYKDKLLYLLHNCISDQCLSINHFYE